MVEFHLAKFYSIEKAKNELNAFEIVHKETVAELESVRNALHEREVGADKKEKTKLNNNRNSTKLLKNSSEKNHGRKFS